MGCELHKQTAGPEQRQEKYAKDATGYWHRGAAGDAAGDRIAIFRRKYAAK
jgi:hypothetical protein